MNAAWKIRLSYYIELNKTVRNRKNTVFQNGNPSLFRFYDFTHENERNGIESNCPNRDNNVQRPPRRQCKPIHPLWTFTIPDGNRPFAHRSLLCPHRAPSILCIDPCQRWGEVDAIKVLAPCAFSPRYLLILGISIVHTRFSWTTGFGLTCVEEES